jgi:hypothetical protein
MEKEHILDRIARELFLQEPKEIPESETSTPNKHNLKKPPGLVGEVTEYINSQCLYAREHLAVIAAITAVGNIGGLNHKLDNGRVSSNIFAFGIAGSGTGKESILQAFNDVHIEAGLSGAVHGKIKSEQEIVRNLLRHQPSYYNIDELGIFLRQLAGSHKSGGAAYLQGVIGMLMSAYSKASGTMLLSGDVKEEAKERLYKELANLNKKADQGIDCQGDIDSLERQIKGLDRGLANPFLSVMGFSTPTTFNESVSFEQITSGFIGRSLIINEPDNNPKAKQRYICPAMPESLKDQLLFLRATGDTSKRIESNGQYTIIKTTPEASEALSEISEWFWQEAEKHTERTGFEAVVRRGYEMVEKISFILSFGGTERGLEAVEWANEYVRRDIEYKTLLAYSNVKEKTDPVESMAAKILCCIDDAGITVGKIVNRYRAKKGIVEQAISFLESKGRIVAREVLSAGNNKKTRVLYKA